MSGRRFLVAAFGDAGHAFPAIALARELRRRGHHVLVETWERWRDAVEAEGLGFTASEEYKTFPPPAPDSADGASAASAARALLPLMEEFRPDAVVSDVLTAAPALAAEKAGTRKVTLVPHVYPVHEPGMPFFSIGAGPPRTPLGRALWRAWLPLLTSGLRRGRREMNETRAAVGLPPVRELHGGMSRELVLVATLRQLEYPRRWPAHVHVTGPMEFELPYPDIELPPGERPLVLVASSTAQDPELRLLRTSLDALADEPVRVVATTNRRDGDPLPGAPSNARVVDWLSYSQVMPRAALVICHGGHGTAARALGAGAPLLCCPRGGDMAENGARVAWAGAGLMLPWRFLGEASLRWAVRRVLRDPRFTERAGEIASWAHRNDGARRGAELVEALARGGGQRSS
jgi:MGT family glycosyltransferase